MMTPMPPWTLRCDECEWSALVFPRGAHGRDPGAGVEAALLLARHREQTHAPIPEPDGDDTHTVGHG